MDWETLSLYVCVYNKVAQFNDIFMKNHVHKLNILIGFMQIMLFIEKQHYKSKVKVTTMLTKQNDLGQ